MPEAREAGAEGVGVGGGGEGDCGDESALCAAGVRGSVNDEGTIIFL